MLCIFKGRPTSDGKHADKEAGVLLALLHTRFQTATGECFCEHANQRNDKAARIQVVTQRQLRDSLSRFERNVLGKFPDLATGDLFENKVINEIADLSAPQEVLLSPALQLIGLTVNDLPPGSYGNGLTCNYVVPVKKFTFGSDRDEASALSMAVNLVTESETQGLSVKIESGITKLRPVVEGYYMVNIRLSWWCVDPLHSVAVKANWAEICDIMEK